MGFKKKKPKSSRFKTRTSSKTLIIYLDGMLDMTEAFQIEQDLIELVTSNSEYNLILNMEKVTSISSSGIRVFIALLRLLKSSKRTLKLCEVSHDVLEIFTFVGLRSLFTFFPTEKDALNDK
jgi:anti-sigma B factor antagonist